MALYLKQDFSPPLLSRKWIIMKFRPNMLLYSRRHIISILESGLLFREDSVEVEQESPASEEVWRAAGGGASGWLTRGERVAAAAAVLGCVLACPPRNLRRSTVVQLAAYLALPVAIRACHRALCRGSLASLLDVMREYLALARRAAACLKEYKAFRAQLESVCAAVESTHTMLCRQQSELSVTMSRASSALLGNAPWLRTDLAWDAVTRHDTDNNLQKIHHAFLVVQSTLLKHIAMAHYIPSTNARKIYKNHNERLYWLHSVLITHLHEEFKQSYEALQRMYRLLKNFGNVQSSDNKKLGSAVKDSWVHSEVHNGIARTNLELKVALDKSNDLDMFLDSCALNKQEINLEVLNKDIESLIDGITKCLNTAQGSQLRLKKLLYKFNDTDVAREEEVVEDKSVLKIEDKDPVTCDEVFYFVKTEDDDVKTEHCQDISTAPGKKEKETTKIVLNELKMKLVRREDVMRERERQALAKTMPELKDNVPEFPRQNNVEDANVKRGYINKIRRRSDKKSLFNKKIGSDNKCNGNLKKLKLQIDKYEVERDLETKHELYEGNSKLNSRSLLLSFAKCNDVIVVTKWCKASRTPEAASLDATETSGPRERNVETGEKILEDNQRVLESKKKNLECRERNLESRERDLEYVERNLEFRKRDTDTSDESVGLSDVEAAAMNKTTNQAFNFNQKQSNGEAKNFRFTKKDLELSPSSSDSDFESYKDRNEMLKDVRRSRAMRRKNHQKNKEVEACDESLRPMEYSLGAGLALASLLQRHARAQPPHELTYDGAGEVSPDSGHDDDK